MSLESLITVWYPPTLIHINPIPKGIRVYSMEHLEPNTRQVLGTITQPFVGNDAQGEFRWDMTVCCRAEKQRDRATEREGEGVRKSVTPVNAAA